MSVDNHTPFPAIAFRQMNLAGDMLGVVAVRGTFRLAKDGPLVLDDTQRPLVMSDTYEGDPHVSPLVACTDLAPFKPGTDITYQGFSFAPGGVEAARWECGLSVGGAGKRLAVTGPRHYEAATRKSWAGLLDRAKEDAFDGWHLSAPEPVRRVPLDWRLAFGGRPPLAPETEADEPEDIVDGAYRYNPLGRGLVEDGAFPEYRMLPAPQIEDADAPIDRTDARPQAACFAPISPWWRQRQQYAGTYDDAWLNERHPLLPRDFDFRFWQCAPPDLVAQPWLKGNEAYRLENLLAQHPILEGRLPGIELMVEADMSEDTRANGPMVLDGVHFDMRPGVGRVFLTWRIAFPWPKRIGRPRLTMRALTPAETA